MSLRDCTHQIVCFCSHLLSYVGLWIEKKQRYCAYVCRSELCSVHIDCWFSWSLLSAWQPTDMLCHWALVCNNDSISPGNQGRAGEWKIHIRAEQSESSRAEVSQASRGRLRALLLRFKLHPSCSKTSLESTVCVNMRNPLGRVDFNQGQGKTGIWPFSFLKKMDVISLSLIKEELKTKTNSEGDLMEWRKKLND